MKIEIEKKSGFWIWSAPLPNGNKLSVVLNSTAPETKIFDEIEKLVAEYPQ